jgi:hypothetical protein
MSNADEQRTHDLACVRRLRKQCSPYLRWQAQIREVVAKDVWDACDAIERLHQELEQLRKAVLHTDLVVHVLFNGVALCGAGAPWVWPPEHRWAYLEDLEHVTCEGCKREAPRFQKTAP